MKKLLLLSVYAVSLFFINIDVSASKYAVNSIHSGDSNRSLSETGNINNLKLCPPSKNRSDFDNCYGKWSKDSDYPQDIYQGEWKNGSYHGQGIYTWTSGTQYVGEFKGGLMHGQGTMTYTDGRFVEGKFIDGDLTGKGKLTYLNGDIYEGEFEWFTWSYDIEGFGKMRYADGSIYAGQWKDSKKNGKGLVVEVDGTIYKGEWQYDKIIDGTYKKVNLNTTEDGIDKKQIGYRDLTIGSSSENISKNCEYNKYKYYKLQCYNTDDIRFKITYGYNKDYINRQSDVEFTINYIAIYVGPYVSSESGEDPYLNLGNALKKNYSIDWEWTERDRVLFNENKKNSLWVSFENGQVMLEIKREGYDMNLYVHYYTEDDGKKYSEERKPKNTNFSDF